MKYFEKDFYKLFPLYLKKKLLLPGCSEQVCNQTSSNKNYITLAIFSN